MNSFIYLNDLLGIKDLSNVRIRFNQLNCETDPIEEYKKDPEIINNQWFFWRTKKRYFNVGQIAICLLKLKNDMWLLTTIKKVEKEFNVKNGINYEGTEIEQYSAFYGRVIINYHKNYTSQGRIAKGVIEQFEVVQILPSVFDGEEFPGYDKVRLMYEQLSTIILRGNRDWIAALENQKAVYLIRDTYNGKLYVGSATGENGMLLQRWESYVKNGHGGNVELKEIVQSKGFDYVKKYFQYAILENYNSRVDKHIVLNRESWWKKTLGTRIPNDYNRN